MYDVAMYETNYLVKHDLIAGVLCLNLGNERKGRQQRSKKSRKRAATELSCDCCCQVRGWVERLMVLPSPSLLPRPANSEPFTKTTLKRLEI